MPGPLDDLKYLHQHDGSDALGLASKQWQQLEAEFDFEVPAGRGPIENIVHAGMGGSTFGANFAKVWPGFLKPLEAVQDYTLPAYVNQKTLCIITSYSGNTTEALAAARQAGERGAQIVVVTSGGALMALAREKQYPLVVLPPVTTTCFGSLYRYKALVQVGERFGVVTAGAAAELCSAAMFLGRSITGWLADVPVNQNAAKQLAMDIIGTSPVIYSGPLLAPAAHNWKTGFNVYANNVAWQGVLPELSHNEAAGWTSHPVEKPYSIIFLQAPAEDARIAACFSLCEKQLSGRWPAPHLVAVQGETKLQQLLWAAAYGDFVTLYTAFLNGINPISQGERDIIKTLKQAAGAIS